MIEPKRRDYVEHDDYGRGIVLEVFGCEPNRFAEVDWDERREPRHAVLVNTLHPVDDTQPGDGGMGPNTRATLLAVGYTAAEHAAAQANYAADYAAGHVTRGWANASPRIRLEYLVSARARAVITQPVRE